MSWDKDVEELKRRTAMAREMGGADNVAFHHGRGKLTVRERISLLEDEGNFQEVGVLAGAPAWDGPRLESLRPSNTVIGTDDAYAAIGTQLGPSHGLGYRP